MKWISYLDPLSHFLALLRNIMLKGGENYFVASRITILMVMAMVFIFISFKRFKTTLQ
jgi:ABC-2 type transport system permease protein